LSGAVDAQFSEHVASWLTKVVGGDVGPIVPIVAGTRSSWSVDIDRNGDVVPVIVRRTRDTLQIYGDGRRETAIYSALGPTPVPVPQIYGIDDEYNLVAAQRVPGTDDLSQLAERGREQLCDDFMRHLANLHALDPNELELPPMQSPTSPREHHTLDVDHWQDFHRANAPANPVVTYACNWLRRTAPDDVRATVLVQGDTGPGNFVQDDGRVTAIVDWELSHLGDAYEDLGWIVARSLLFPFGDLRRRFAVYEEASGLPFDRQRIWHGAVSAMTKVLIAGDVVRARGHEDPQYPIMISGPAFHGRLVIEALYMLAGLEIPKVEVNPLPLQQSERAGSLAFLRTTLRGRLLPNLSGAAELGQTKAALRTVRHLQRGERYDVPIELQECNELSALLGDDVAAGADGRRLLATRLDADSVDDTAALAYLGRHVQRETIRMAELLGPMATTPLPIF
jgi:aminoglycoside phosphotransferase (APT) family kinase protein